MLKNDFLYVIPSYNRVNKQVTVNYLNEIGILKDRIYVFVQTEKDAEQYRNVLRDKAVIVYKPATRGVEARNNILNELINSCNVLMLDDDIRAIGKLQDRKIVKIETSDEMDGVFTECFACCEKRRAYFFGVYPVYNAYFMENTISTKSPINTIFGFTNGFKGRYDLTYDTKEDAALCAKILVANKPILRFNYLAVDADHRKTKNGYIDDWHQEENIRCVKKLILEFPTVYKMQTNKPWEVRTIIKDKKIKI